MEETNLNPTTEQPETPPAGDAVSEALDRVAAAAGPDFDRSQMDTLKAKLAKLGQSDAKTTSGSEAPAEGLPSPGTEAPRVLTGRDVDWSEYDLDYNIAHLYPKAVFRETPQGPMWVAMVTDFLSTTREFKYTDTRVNRPGSLDKKITDPLYLGAYLNDMCNGREEWKIAAVMPAGQQCGVLLERQVPLILPTPNPLKKSEEVAPPSDPQLLAVEDAALAFAAEQNPVDNEPEMRDDTTTGDIGLRVADPETVYVDEQTGAIDARTTGGAVASALALNAMETEPAPTAGVVQPEAVPGNVKAYSNLNPEGKVAAGGYSAAQDLLRALNDPNFRAQLPQDE